jgi:hypothetical protein
MQISLFVFTGADPENASLIAEKQLRSTFADRQILN